MAVLPCVLDKSLKRRILTKVLLSRRGVFCGNLRILSELLAQLCMDLESGARRVVLLLARVSDGFLLWAFKQLRKEDAPNRRVACQQQQPIPPSPDCLD